MQRTVGTLLQSTDDINNMRDDRTCDDRVDQWTGRPSRRVPRAPMKGACTLRGTAIGNGCRNASTGPEALSSVIAPPAAITGINICLCRRRRPLAVTAASVAVRYGVIIVQSLRASTVHQTSQPSQPISHNGPEKKTSSYRCDEFNKIWQSRLNNSPYVIEAAKVNPDKEAQIMYDCDQSWDSLVKFLINYN